MALIEQVRRELLAIRKLDSGLTLGALAHSPTLVALLGEGDPAIALNTLKLKLLESDHSLAMQAAMASLGLSAAGTTHLARLETFGRDHGYEQRQARRYSDKGITQLAQLIATHWVGSGTPSLDVTLWQTSERECALHMSARSLSVVEMRTPEATVRQGDVVHRLDLDLVRAEHPWHVRQHSLAPVVIDQVGTSCTIVWRGELWPKFSVTFAGGSLPDTRFETLGAKLMIRW